MSKSSVSKWCLTEALKIIEVYESLNEGVRQKLRKPITTSILNKLMDNELQPNETLPLKQSTILDNLN